MELKFIKRRLAYLRLRETSVVKDFFAKVVAISTSKKLHHKSLTGCKYLLVYENI